MLEKVDQKKANTNNPQKIKELRRQATLKRQQTLSDSMFESLSDSNTMANRVIENFALPHKNLMYKIMRSCIGVRREEDLWVHMEPTLF